MLVPLTQSLYVPGELADTDHVLVDIGTGYFVEVRGSVHTVCIPRPWLVSLVYGMSRATSCRPNQSSVRGLEQKTMDQGVDYCKRKVNLIAENLNKISKVRGSMLLADCLFCFRGSLAGKIDKLMPPAGSSRTTTDAHGGGPGIAKQTGSPIRQQRRLMALSIANAASDSMVPEPLSKRRNDALPMQRASSSKTLGVKNA